jgi:hypothetical protein
VGGIWPRCCLRLIPPYAHFLAAYVVRVETKKYGDQYRTVGSEKSAKALRDYPGESDERLLEIAGLNDGDIEKMWTPSSVRRARVELFISYLATLCLMNFALGAHKRSLGAVPPTAAPPK